MPLPTNAQPVFDTPDAGYDSGFLMQVTWEVTKGYRIAFRSSPDGELHVGIAVNGKYTDVRTVQGNYLRAFAEKLIDLADSAETLAS